jgi:hypothetical protein
MRRIATAALIVAFTAAACSKGGTGDDDDDGIVDAGHGDATQHADSSGGTEASAGHDTGTTLHDTGTDTSVPEAASNCKPFAEGLNVAWLSFASDVPTPNISTSCPRCFSTLFTNTFNAGGRVVRWWFHTNGTITPGYDTTNTPGLALPISASDIADVKSILDAAQAAGVQITISLWSFDMLQGANESIPDTVTANNMNLLTTAAGRNAYITNVLTPLVTAIGNHPGLYSWEIFNEPEGMTTQNGWVPMANRIDESVVQTCVNWFADAIHQANPTALVTNGTWTFFANSTVTGQSYVNDYSDTALTTAGGKAKGTLDYYEVHYYDNFNNSNVISPFTHPSTYWNLDKNIVIGEFWPIDTNGVAAADLYTTLYDSGYYGGWSWQYANADNPGPDAATEWPAMQQPMLNLYAERQAGIQCSGGTAPDGGDEAGEEDASTEAASGEDAAPEAASGEDAGPPEASLPEASPPEAGPVEAGVDAGMDAVADAGVEAAPVDSGTPPVEASTEASVPPTGCAPGAVVIALDALGNSGNFGTLGAVCITFQGTVSGWNASNVEGRTVIAMGSTTQTPTITGDSLGNQPGIAPGADGFIYWNYTAGTVAFSSMSLF